MKSSPSVADRRSPTRYSLVVSRGYVRLARYGDLPSTRLVGRRFIRMEGEWVEAEPQPLDRDLLDDIQAELCLQLDDTSWIEPDPLDQDVQSAIEEALHPRRGDAGLSARSRMNMRRMFVSLPWELLGRRPALISLTYPALWQRCVPEGRVWEAHRRAFERRWVRKWGEPLVGVWVKEFQASGRPHLHLYVGLPSTMSDENFAGLRERTLQRHRLERQYDRYEARRKTPPLGIPWAASSPTGS